MWGLAIEMVRIVCPSVRLSVCLSHANISKRDRHWLLGNANRKPGFTIQNLPSDSRLEVRFCQFDNACHTCALLWVDCSDKLYRKDGTTLGTVAGQLSSRPISDDTLCYSVHVWLQQSHDLVSSLGLFRYSRVLTRDSVDSLGFSNTRRPLVWICYQRGSRHPLTTAVHKWSYKSEETLSLATAGVWIRLLLPTNPYISQLRHDRAQDSVDLEETTRSSAKILGGAGHHEHRALSFWCLECCGGSVSMEGATTRRRSSVERERKREREK